MDSQPKKAKHWKLLAIFFTILLVIFTSQSNIVEARSARLISPPSQTSLGSSDHYVGNIYLAPPTPNILEFNQDVNITFDYSTNEAGGVRIWARPFTNGSLTPHYAAHGSPIHPVGTGTIVGSFTVLSGEVTVDQIRFQIWKADQSELLYEAFIPVHYQFTDSTHRVSNIVLAPPTPNILGFNQDVTITFDYTTNEAGGVRIWARPFTNGSLTPHYAAHGSPIHPVGTGTIVGSFTITSGDVTVDQIRFQIWKDDQSELLHEVFIPVNYQFNDTTNLINNIVLTPPTANILGFNQDVTITFDYSTNEVGGVRIWARPFSKGSLTPNYAAHGSPLYPVGTGSGSGSFTITSGDVKVDHIRFQMWDNTNSHLIYEAFVPVCYLFGETSCFDKLYLPIILK